MATSILRKCVGYVWCASRGHCRKPIHFQLEKLLVTQPSTLQDRGTLSHADNRLRETAGREKGSRRTRCGCAEKQVPAMRAPKTWYGSIYKLARRHNKVLNLNSSQHKVVKLNDDGKCASATSTMPLLSKVLDLLAKDLPTHQRHLIATSYLFSKASKRASASARRASNLETMFTRSAYGEVSGGGGGEELAEAEEYGV